MLNLQKTEKIKRLLFRQQAKKNFIIGTASRRAAEDSSTGGSGDEAEGDIIGEESIREEEGEGQGAGQGKGGQHGMGAEAYEIGRILTEQFELPNIKEKGKKTSLQNILMSYQIKTEVMGRFSIRNPH